MQQLNPRDKTKSLARLALLVLALLLMACASAGSPTIVEKTIRKAPTGVPTIAAADLCPAKLRHMLTCLTPHSMRVAYGIQSLIDQGMTGKEQTVVDIVSFGSPTLQKDMDVFDQQFGLPAITLDIRAPIGTAKTDLNNKDQQGWAEETTLDTELIHAMAPGANIVVLTSPVAETEGTIGLPEFLQLEQYAVKEKLGQIFSQSYVASETTLDNSAGREL